ncbi:MAG: hypothetical protein AABX70_06230 [Nanoarchaeota archaeon]
MSKKDKSSKFQDELLNVSRKNLQVNKKHLEISKEHKNIGGKQLKQLEDTMSKKEQRIWWGASIVVTLIIGLITGGIYVTLSSNRIIQTPDYNVNVQANPNEVELNTKGDVLFNFNVTNTGKKNISDLSIREIKLYKINKYRADYCGDFRPIETPNLGNFPVGESRIIYGKVPGPTDQLLCFNDRERMLQFYIYFRSVPPTNIDKIVNISIY